MVNDRRSYSRLSIVDVPVLLYIENANFEIEGYVHDISELGIGIAIDPDVDLSKVNIDPNTEVKLVFCDEVYYASHKDKFVIMCDCIVKHAEVKDNRLFLGGAVANEDFRNYYLKKEMVNFNRREN